MSYNNANSIPVKPQADGTVIGSNGTPIGKVNYKGEVIDSYGNVVGKVDASGNVVDKYGNPMMQGNGGSVPVKPQEDGTVIGPSG